MAWLSLTFVLTSTSVAAQVNVEPLRKKVRDRGVSGALEANATGRLGNVEGVVAGGMAQVGFANERHLAFAHARGDYSGLNARTQLSRTFAHARYSLTFAPWLFGEVFAQVQTDEFLLLRHRELYGAGPRFGLYEGREVVAYAGVAAMLEYERVNVPAGAPDPRETMLVRGSSYLAVTLTEGKELSFSAVGFFQPSLADPRDFRATLETTFEVAVRKFFSVRIYGSVRHDSAPVSSVRRTDLELRNALAFTF